MPTLYFCQPHAKNQGILRAVLSVNECERVVSQHPATYVGEQFPKLGSEQAAANDFAVLNLRPNEAPAGWRRGYYWLDSDLTKLNESLVALSPQYSTDFFNGRSRSSRGVPRHCQSPVAPSNCRPQA